MVAAVGSVPRFLTITLISDGGSTIVWEGERGCPRKGFDKIVALAAAPGSAALR
jgi:hypothetical protein